MGEVWIVLSKLVVLVYTCIKYIQGGMYDIAPSILAILAYIILSMLYYLFKSSTVKKTIIIASLILLIILSVKINLLYVFLLPANIIDIVYTFGFVPYFSLLALAPIALVGGLASEYLIVAILIAFIYIISVNADKREEKLTNNIDKNREKLDVLHKQLDTYEQFRKQENYLLQLEERNNIAQRIHDRVGHSISGSLIQLEAAQLVVEKDTAKTKSIINNVIGVLREGMKSIREALHNIKPPVEQLGINRIKSILDEFKTTSNIGTNLTYTGDLSRINFIQWKVICDNLTECLTNSLKHSKCTNISININVLNKVLKVEIKDNGIGATRIEKELGLSGIEERSVGIGGKAIFDGFGGFSVITLLPIGGEKRNEH